MIHRCCQLFRRALIFEIESEPLFHAETEAARALFRDAGPILSGSIPGIGGASRSAAPKRTIPLVFVARRFRCMTVTCGRRISTKHFNDGTLPPLGRINGTARFVRPLPWPCHRWPASGELALRLTMPVSNDTLLRVARRRGYTLFAAPISIVFNDRAGSAISGRKNYSTSSIICHRSIFLSWSTLAISSPFLPTASSRIAAVNAAITTSWSNGQTEDQINKFKVLPTD
jgi:hypothetical protein